MGRSMKRKKRQTQKELHTYRYIHTHTHIHTVVAHPMVEDGHANVTQNVVGEVGPEEGGQAFVAVHERVLFEEVVFAAIAADFQFLICICVEM
jgi:hypothetical protein